MSGVERSIHVEQGVDAASTSPRRVGRHVANAFIGIAACYALLFGASEMQSGRQAKVEPSQPTEEATSTTLLGAMPDDRSLDSLALTAGIQRNLGDDVAQAAQVFNERRLKAEGYMRALTLARQDVAALEDDSSKAAAAQAASIEQAQRALDVERGKTQQLEAELVADRDQLEQLTREAQAARQDVEAARRDTEAARRETEVATRERQEAQAGETRERETSRRIGAQVAELERSLAMARQDAGKASRVAVNDKLALQQSWDRAAALTRDLVAARDEIQRLKLRDALRYVRAAEAVETAKPTKPVAKRTAQPQPKPKSRNVVARKAQRSTQFLPASLLPTQPPLGE